MTNKAIQSALNMAGFGPLLVDGKIGARTIYAIKEFQKLKGLVPDGKVGPKTEKFLIEATLKPIIIEVPKPKGKLLSTQELIDIYGQPGPTNLVVLELPFTMKIGWDKTSICKKIQCHKKIADNLHQVLEDILEHYGLERIQELQIDDYWGCYNFRKMRGGNDWSRHSWGVAIDLDADRNALHQSHTTAQFAKEEYKPMIEAFYKNGFVGLGPERDYDWMHWQIGY